MSRTSKSVILLALLWMLVSAGFGQISVLTQHNDNSRTGQNLQETVLNTSTVNVSNFGKLFALPVDSNIYVQPLYVPNLTIGGSTHNVVYVATAQNSVYAFDADSGNTTPLWTVNLGTPVPSQDICSTDPTECPYTDVIPVIGIVATPVIDAENSTIYVVANTKDTSSKYHFKLHALDLATGAEKFGGPTEIAATGFAAFTELNHPGLLLVNGTIYLGFGSVGDFPTWHGYVMAYDATTLQQVAVFNSTPQSNSVGGAGIWQTGNGLVADASGNIYAVTSNGNFDVNTGGQDYGSAYLKLGPSNLAVQDYFVPYNQSYLNPETNNVDLGSGGPLLIPNTTLLVGGGKDAVLRVVDTSNMGKFNSVQDSNHQNLIGATNPPIFGSPVYWDSPNLGPLIYMWGQGDYAKAWTFNAQTELLSTTPAMESTFQGTAGWNDQAALSISANESTAGTGILWASMPYSGISNPGPVPGVLYALDATNLKTVLWDSQMNASRDSVGNYAKFVPPTVANGKVYLATFSGQLLVYGENPSGSSQIEFIQANAGTPQTSTSSVTVPFKAAQTQGNLNVVVVGWNDTTTTVQSVMDNLGNQYALAAGPIQGTGLSQEIYYAKDILGGSNSVIVTFSKPASYPDVRVLEYSGADVTSPVDVVASAGGNSATANSGSATTKFASELILGADTVATGNLAAGSNFTSRILTSPDSDLAEDRTVVSTGAYSATATLTASGPWVMEMVALKANGSSGTGGTAPTISTISPSSGTINGGTAVTITGTNFAAGATVSFGGTAASNVTVVSSTSITATTPVHAAGAVNVVVSDVNGSATSTNGFTYTSTAPAVSTISPSSGTINGGTAVTITGTNFVVGATVSLGSTAASNVTVVSSTSITATTPAHAAGAVNVVVTDSNGTGTLSNGFTYTTSTASIGFAQVASATPQSSVASVKVTYPQAQTAGDLNLVVVGWNDTSATVSSVTDSLGNSYTLAAGPLKGTALTQSIYYAKGILGGSNSVTVTFNQAAAYPDVRILEYKGLSTTAPLDVTAGASGTSGSNASVSSGSATTTSANELIFGAGTTSGGFSKAGTLFKAEVITSSGDIAEDEVVSATGSNSATATLGAYGSQNWVMQMVALKAGSGGGGTAPAVSTISPSSGTINGGTAVTITGTNFVAGATVSFGGTAASNVTVVSSTSITATTPAHAAGAVNVVVTDSNGTGTLSNGFTYTTSTASIGFAQVASATPQSSVASVKVTYPQAQTAGDLNLVVVGWNDTSATVSSVTDSLGNSYTLAAGPLKGTALTQSIYYAKGILGGSNSVTVTFNQAAAYPDVRILEYKGLSTTAPLDVTAGASGTSGSNASVSSGSATTTSANELIFGAGTTSGGFSKAGTLFKAEVITSSGDIAEDEVVSATGSNSATATLGAYGSQNWVMQMVALKP